MIGLGLSLTQVAGRVRRGFVPSDLGASLLAAWDAGSGVTQSGGLVSSWASSVGGYALAQATGSLKPAYNATGVNGRPSIDFDGVDDFLNYEACPFPVSAATCELWMLARNDAGDATARTAFCYGGVSATTVRRLIRSGGNAVQTSVGTGAATVTVSSGTPSTFTGSHVVRGVVDGTNITTHRDGVAGTATACVPGTSATRTRMGALTGTSSSLFWQGGIVAVYITGLLTVGQAASLTVYLKARGGVP